LRPDASEGALTASEPYLEMVRADGPWWRLGGRAANLAMFVGGESFTVIPEPRNPVIATGRGDSIRRFATGVERESAGDPPGAQQR
jgi:hypothetical protein